MTRNSRRFLDGAVIFVFMCAAAVAVLRVGLAPSERTENIAVVYAPWTDRTDTFTQSVAAGGRFVRFGGAAFVAIVAPETTAYAANARAAHAWLVLDARLLLACLGGVLP
jgi:hypothetical protein